MLSLKQNLFGGPKTIQDLARRLQTNGYYEGLYRLYSGHTHANSALRNARPKRGSPDTYLLRLRHPVDLTTTTNVATSLALETFRLLHQIFLTDRDLASYAEWYIANLRADFMRVGSLTITDPNIAG